MKPNSCDVWIALEDHALLMAHLFPGDSEEHGAILQAGVVTTEKKTRLVVRHVALAKDGSDYVVGKVGHRALDPTFIHRMIVECRKNRLAYLAVHNHDCDDHVGFSRIDMNSHELGYPALRDIGKGVPVGALVFGRRSVQADIWFPDGSRRLLGEFRVIGSTLSRFYASPRHAETAASSLDRQIRMFGAGGQKVLQDSTVAVIGLGGIGSLVAEYLARLGLGEILLIDPDRIESTNLARVVGATPADVEVNLLKTQIALRHAREVSVNKLVEIADDVAKASVAAALKGCDYIFLAADSMRARLLVNAITHQYLIPSVQLGAKIRPSLSGNLDEAMSAVRQVRPGHGCLWCNGLVDTTQLAIEAKTDQERKDQAYGVYEPNPSVITLNAVAAAHAVNEFLFDFLNLRTSESKALYWHFHFVRQTIKHVVPCKDPQCKECVRRFGMGDAMDLPVLAG